LRGFTIVGITSNIGLLIRILESPQFRAGETDTGFLDRELPL
jgi:pyruvate carboxylase